MKKALTHIFFPRELGVLKRSWRKSTLRMRTVSAWHTISLLVLLPMDVNCAAWPLVALNYAISAVAFIATANRNIED